MAWHRGPRWPHERVKGSTQIARVGFLAVDLETSGLDPKRDQILSIGAVAVDALAVRLDSAWHALVQAGALSADIGAQYHGLGHDDLERGVPLAAVLADFESRAAGRVLIAHGAGIERAFLSAAFAGLDRPGYRPQIVDTLLLEQRRRAGLGTGQYRLAAARARYNLPRYPAHHALSDALACAELFLAQTAHGGFKLLKSVLAA